MFDALAAMLDAGGVDADAARLTGTSTCPDTSGWTVLHTLGATGSNMRRVASVPDCVFIVPGKGVLVLAVDRCRRLRLQDGAWFYDDEDDPDPSGPFRRAAGAARRLREHTTARNRQFARIPVWSAVCLPFADFDQDSSDWHRWQVLDRAALCSQPLARLVEAALDQARALLIADQADWFHPERLEPRLGQCEPLVALLRPEFELANAETSLAQASWRESRHQTSP